MRRKKYYERSLEEIIKEKEEEIQDSELQATTVNLPQLIRVVLADIKERNRELNWQKISRKIIEHGFSIMEHEYSEVVREVGQLRRKLRYAKMRRVRNYTMDAKVCIDGTNKMARKSIKIRKKIFAGINTMASTLGLEMSSLVRLCIYHSLITSSELPKEVIEASEKEIEKFIYDLEETRNILEKFELGEQDWDVRVKKIREWKERIITRLKNEEVELELEPESEGEQNEEKQTNL